MTSPANNFFNNANIVLILIMIGEIISIVQNYKLRKEKIKNERKKNNE